MDEDQIYKELISQDADYIIEEVKNIENDVGTQSIEIYIPFALVLIIIGILQLTQLLILMRMQDQILHQKSNAIICLLTLQTAIQIDY